MTGGLILFGIVVLLGFRRETRLKEAERRILAEQEAARARAAAVPKRSPGRPRKTTTTKP